MAQRKPGPREILPCRVRLRAFSGRPAQCKAAAVGGGDEAQAEEGSHDGGDGGQAFPPLRKPAAIMSGSSDWLESSSI